MTWHTRVAVSLALCLAVVPTAPGQEPPAKKAKVEFRWLEDKPVEGVTENKGFQTTCGPELSYPHRKPILVNKDVAKARLVINDARNGASIENYEVRFDLTKEAKKALVDSLGREQAGSLAIFVNGVYKGTYVFRTAESEAFSPAVYYLGAPLSNEQKAEAWRLFEAFK